MSVRLVARATLRESNRGMELPLLVAMFAALFAVVGVLSGASSGSVGDLVDILAAVCALVVPIVGLMLGQPAIAAKREDGRLRLLFGQPIGRTGYLAGTYLAKAIVLLLALAAGVIGAIVAFVGVGGSFAVDPVLRLAAWTALLGLAYLGLAVAFSATSRTTRWATFNMLGLYLGLVFVWRLAPHLVLLLGNGLSFPETVPPWVDLVSGLSPSVAFERLLGFNGVEFFEATNYTSTEFSLAVLAVWIVLIPALGCWRFVSTDLS